jgi:hypothetical protein
MQDTEKEDQAKHECMLYEPISYSRSYADSITRDHEPVNFKDAGCDA